MKFVTEYRDSKIAKNLVEAIHSLSKTPANFMEVCGTHTVAISKNALRQVMPKTITLLSGPGCPVCVTANRDIDKAIALAENPEVILTTFGDMMKVPGSYNSLSYLKAEGADIRVVYSTLDALRIAESNPQRKVVFFAVGFETTSPTVAQAALRAREMKLTNFYILSVHKIVPPAMKALLSLGEVKLHGFLCPGHVSAIIGSKPYQFVVDEFHIPCVIAGFEPLDILQGIYMLVKQVEEGAARVEIQYRRGMRPTGNTLAVEQLYEVFEVCDAEWRGIGVIPASGLKLREEFSDLDADLNFSLQLPPTREPKGCSCGEILRGVKFPYQCKLYGKACTPENPVGPCMVSTEGACAAYFRYDPRREE